MATWIAHIRLAENLLKYGFELDIPSFLAGNVAPDSGIATPNGYVPHKDLTHWRDMNGNIQPEDFYAQHLEGKSYEAKQYAFLMGYYLHLVADNEWIGNIWQPNVTKNPLWMDLKATDSNYERVLKKDWYGLDFCYLHNHPESLYFSHFLGINAVPDYLDIFPTGAFTEGIQKVKNYYANAESTQLSLAHDYRYLDEEAMLMWIDCATVTMLGVLKSKDVPCPDPHPLFGERYIQSTL
jgi:hypothetical protein